MKNIVKKDRMQILIEEYQNIISKQEYEDEYEKELYENDKILAKKRLIRQEKIELLKMKLATSKTKRQLKRKIQNIIDDLELQREYSINPEEIDRKIKKLKEQMKNYYKKIDLILIKHENNMFDKLNSLGITDEEMKISRKTINNKDIIKNNKKQINKQTNINQKKTGVLSQKDERNKITVQFNIEKGTYVLIDDQGYKYERDFNDRLTNKKEKKEFAIEILEKYFKQPDQEDIKLVQDVAQKSDINLYSLYEQYDKENETEYARKYLEAIYDEDKNEMPTNVIYNFSKIKKDEKQNVKLNLRDKIIIKKMAKQQNKIGIVDINEEQKVSVWKKIAIGLGLLGGITALGAGTTKIDNNNCKDEQEKEIIEWEDIHLNKSTLKENLKIDIVSHENGGTNEETLNKDIKKLKNINIGIGSKAELNEATYYYNSEFAKPTGKMGNRENKIVEIEYIAAVGKVGEYKCCATNGNIENIKEEFPDSKIMIAIKNDETILGWIEYDENMKETFEKYAIEENKQLNEKDFNEEYIEEK